MVRKVRGAQNQKQKIVKRGHKQGIRKQVTSKSDHDMSENIIQYNIYIQIEGFVDNQCGQGGGLNFEGYNT